jgi:hypothetical protein
MKRGGDRAMVTATGASFAGARLVWLRFIFWPIGSFVWDGAHVIFF